jgi:hypothetical protein
MERSEMSNVLQSAGEPGASRCSDMGTGFTPDACRRQAATKPTSLRPGDLVRRVDGSGVVLTFVRRDGRARRSVFFAHEYVGQNGPDDKGFVVVDDSSVCRNFTRHNAGATGEQR